MARALLPAVSCFAYWTSFTFRYGADRVLQWRSLRFSSRPMSADETSLILLKPDCVTKGHCGEVLRRFEREGFTVRGMKMMELSKDLLHEHYAHVADKPFFPDIVAFMQSSPVVAIALSGPDVVRRVRDLLGPTDSAEAPPGTIRGDMGENKMVNVAHASDSLETAEIELRRFFKPGEIFVR